MVTLMSPFGGVYGVVTLALPVVPEVLWDPFLDSFLFVVVSGSRLAIQCPLGFLLCSQGFSVRSLSDPTTPLAWLIDRISIAGLAD